MTTALPPIRLAEAATDLVEVERAPTLEERVALIACGTQADRPCDTHIRKAGTFLQLAHTRALDALAAAICNVSTGGAWRDCTAKAGKILALTAITPVTEVSV